MIEFVLILVTFFKQSLVDFRPDTTVTIEINLKISYWLHLKQ